MTKNDHNAEGLSRRDVLRTAVAAAGASLLGACKTGPSSSASSSPTGRAMSVASIDRAALVRRHNPVVRAFDPFSALTIGNGNFAFTADATGLQSFPEIYDKQFPLCTTAHWAWHSNPEPAAIVGQKIRYKDYDAHGRKVGYAVDGHGQEELFNWLRENPHRMHLGQVGLVLTRKDGTRATAADITDAEQTLDLWSGVITSRFRCFGQPAVVATAVHPKADLLGIRVVSPLLVDQRLKIRIAFPYPSPAMDMADWKSPEKHKTSINSIGLQRCYFGAARTIDQTQYHVEGWTDGTLAYPRPGPHELIVLSYEVDERNPLELVLRFSQKESEGASSSSVQEIFSASSQHWEKFWTEGGAIDLSGSTDSRASELERRIVLSQYNTAIHCAGPMPPPESGLLFNTWYGKSHLEMHWWHGAHFAAWNRLPLLARSFDWYSRIMHVGRDTAVRQGYAGVRWPKMVGPDGADSPSPIGPLLIWQQPHLLYFAELCYQQDPSAATLSQWNEIVNATAEFMASYPVLVDGRYVLGPPLKPVPENTPTGSTSNPTFELGYWRMGLNIAQQWRLRQGLAPDAKWADVLARLAPLPVDQGRYLMMEGMNDTYTKWNWEHPSLLGAYGMQSGGTAPSGSAAGAWVDRETMRASLKKVMDVWQWDRCWGWDFPMAAMTAAKLGEGSLAIDALMIQSVKNQWHPNGHVYQRPNLPAYLPANGGLLAAVAMMCVGTRSTPGRAGVAMGFAADGKWRVRWEGLVPML